MSYKCCFCGKHFPTKAYLIQHYMSLVVKTQPKVDISEIVNSLPAIEV